MAIAHVQDSTLVAGTGTPAAAAMSISPTAGNAVVVCIGQTGIATRTYAVTDDVDGATGWSQSAVFDDANNRHTVIWSKANVPSGITTVTATANTGSTAMAASCAEFSGMGTAITVDASDGLLEAGTGTTHTCSTLGVTSINAVIAVTSGVLTSASTECAAGASYAEIPSAAASGNSLKQYQIFATGCTLEVGTWSNTGAAKVGSSVIALLSGNAGGGRTTKNTRSSPLGMEIGMDWRGEL